MGNLAIALLLAIVGFVVPDGQIPRIVGAVSGFVGWLGLWGAYELVRWLRERRWPRWEMPHAVLESDWNQSYISPEIGPTIRAKFDVSIDGIAVEQRSLSLERAEIAWRTWPLIASGHTRHRIPLDKITWAGSELKLPLPLYQRSNTYPTHLQFDDQIGYRVHDKAPRHSRLFLLLTVGGHTKERCVATVKMRNWDVPAEITPI